MEKAKECSEAGDAAAAAVMAAAETGNTVAERATNGLRVPSTVDLHALTVLGHYLSVANFLMAARDLSIDFRNRDFPGVAADLGDMAAVPLALPFPEVVAVYGAARTGWQLGSAASHSAGCP
jgi:hypothetical protein